MSTTTTRNLLVKPDYTDAADIAVLNTSLDTIDAAIAKCNYAGTAAPTAGDDTADGYSIGSIWMDRTNNNIYVAKSVTAGAAVWTLQALHNNFSATGAPTVNDDIDLHYAPGSMWVDVTNHNVYVCEVNTNGAAVWKQVNSASISGYVKQDGSLPLTADWDVGAYHITADHFVSDVADGTAPYQTTSKTVCTNLNADMLDGLHDTSFVKQTLADAKGDLIVASGADAWARQAVGTDGYALVADSSATNGVSWVRALSGNSANLLINGSFLVNQTGITQYTSATTPANNDDTYLIDNWTLLSDGNDIVDVWQANTTYPTARSASVLLQTETANKKFGIIQFIENKNCRHAIGNYVSLQFKAYTTSANPNANIMAGILSWSSTADTLTSDVVSAWEATNTAPTLAANWTYENVPARLALVADTWTEYKIENVYIDTASTTNIAVFIWLDDTDSTVDDRLYISGVQLNIGSKCVPWSSVDYGTELSNCKRYFMLWNADAAAYGHLGAGPAHTTGGVYIEYAHPTGWFKTAAAVTMIGSWTGNPNVFESMTSECLVPTIVILCSDNAKAYTADHCYLVYANNDTTARVTLTSRL